LQVFAFVYIEIQVYSQDLDMYARPLVLLLRVASSRSEYDYISFSSIVAGRTLRDCRLEYHEDDQCEVAFW